MCLDNVGICHFCAVGEQVEMELAAGNNLEFLTAAQHVCHWGLCRQPHHGVPSSGRGALPGIKSSIWLGSFPFSSHMQDD